MQPFRRVVKELLWQFKLNQIRYNPKLKTMAEGTESSLQLTDVDQETVYHNIEHNEISMLVKVQQMGGRDLPVTSFTESKVARNFKDLTGSDVLLDVERDTEVVPLSLLVFGKHDWEGKEVDISCWMAPKKKLFELYQERGAVSREREEIK